MVKASFSLSLSLSILISLLALWLYVPINFIGGRILRTQNTSLCRDKLHATNVISVGRMRFLIFMLSSPRYVRIKNVCTESLD